MNLLSEHDFEPVPGLPGPLPEGEYMRWQGKPDWRDLAISALHVRKVAVYFVILLAARVMILSGEGATAASMISSGMALATLAGIALGLLCLLAWLAARASRYTLTNRRLVIRCGITLPVSVNLPFSKVVSADLRVRRGGTGDIVLKLAPGSQASWVMLWPHARSFSFGNVQPMLRALPQAEQAAVLVAEALRQYSGASPADDRSPRVVVDPGTGALAAGGSAG